VFTAWKAGPEDDAGNMGRMEQKTKSELKTKSDLIVRKM